MSDREIMNAKGLGKQLELFEDEKLSPKYWQVPFVDEVQEFNELLVNQIIMNQQFLKKKNGCLFMILFKKN